MYFLWYQSWEARQGAIKLSFFGVLLKISGRCSLSDACSYAGLSPSARATAKALEKIPQSSWFDCYCTGWTLTDFVNDRSNNVAYLVQKYSTNISVTWRVVKTNFTFLISRNCCPVMQYPVIPYNILRKLLFLIVNIFLSLDSVCSRPKTDEDCWRKIDSARFIITSDKLRTYPPTFILHHTVSSYLL